MTVPPRKIRLGAAEVATLIRRAIQAGEFQRHERLPSERVMAETYRVSRGTVREALNRLNKEKMVEIRAGSGTYITFNVETNSTIIESARPLELIDTRFALEPHICRLAVLHATKEDFARFGMLLDQMEASVNDPAAFGETDTEFHTALAKSTGNNLLIWIIGQISSVRGLDEWRRMRTQTLDTSIIDKYNSQHRQIINAIRSREPERAATMMKEHLETARLSLTRAADT